MPKGRNHTEGSSAPIPQEVDVDETVAETFPASDAPAWTTLHAGSPAAPLSSAAGPAGAMLDWEAYRRQIAAGMAELARSSPDLIKGYRTIAAAKSATGKLDAKTRELIALAVAVTVRCDGCIGTHVEAARAQGATKDEITEALGVAVMVNAGATLVYSARTLDAFHAPKS